MAIGTSNSNYRWTCRSTYNTSSLCISFFVCESGLWHSLISLIAEMGNNPTSYIRCWHWFHHSSYVHFLLLLLLLLLLFLRVFLDWGSIMNGDMNNNVKQSCLSAFRKRPNHTKGSRELLFALCVCVCVCVCDCV